MDVLSPPASATRTPYTTWKTNQEGRSSPSLSLRPPHYRRKNDWYHTEEVPNSIKEPLAPPQATLPLDKRVAPNAFERHTKARRRRRKKAMGWWDGGEQQDHSPASYGVGIESQAVKAKEEEEEEASREE